MLDKLKSGNKIAGVNESDFNFNSDFVTEII